MKEILHIDSDGDRLSFKIGDVSATELADALTSMVTSCRSMQGKNALLTSVLASALILLKSSDASCVAMFSEDVTKILRSKLTNSNVS